MDNEINDRSVNPLIRIANALEEILRLVKEDQKKMEEYAKKNNDPFGFNKAINWDKLKDPKVLKELEELLDEEEKEKDEEN